MRILCADDEPLALDVLRRSLLTVLPDALVETFPDPLDLWKALEGSPADIVFLDIRMPGISGTELARKIKGAYPLTNIVFTTAYTHYGLLAFDIGASDYLLKPVTPDKIRHALDHLRHTPSPHSDKLLEIRCFGSFEVFHGGVPVEFGRSKSREMMAYLCYRAGSGVTKSELMEAMFGRRDVPYYGVVKKDMIDTLTSIGARDALVNARNNMALVRSRVDCDFFDWLDGKPDGINAYHGEFMTQYPWAVSQKERLFGNGGNLL